MIPAPRNGSLAPAVLTVLTVVTGTAATACGAADTDRVTQVLASPTVSRSPSVAAAAASLVAEMPAVVPVPPGSHVTASAVQTRPDQPGPAGGPELLGVSITGTSRRSTAELLTFFHARLGRAGFTATDDSLLPAGASGAAFGRGEHELLLVAVVDRTAERSWSIGGTVAR